MSDPTSVEYTADRLLQAAYKAPPADIFDQPGTVFTDEDTRLSMSSVGQRTKLHNHVCKRRIDDVRRRPMYAMPRRATSPPARNG